MPPKGKKGKGQQFDSDDDIVDNIPQPEKKGGKQPAQKKGGKKGRGDESEEEDNVPAIPQPAKKGGNKNDNKKKSGNKNQAADDDEVEDDIPQPAKKGGNKNDNKKGGKQQVEEDDEEDIPQPAKKGGKNDKKKGVKQQQEEEEAEEDIPQPAKKGGKNDKKKGGKQQQQAEEDEEEEEDIPQPAKKGKDKKKSAKKQVEEEEEAEEEDIPQPAKKGGKKDKKKGGKQQVEEEEEEEEEEEDIPQPAKKGKDKKKSAKKQVEEEEEEEEEDIPQPAKKGGKNDKKKAGKKQQVEEEEEEEEEEDIPQPAKKGKDKKKSGKSKQQVEEEEEEEEEEDIPQPAKKGGKRDKKKGGNKHQEEEEEEEEEDIPQPAKKGKDKKKSGKSKQQDDEEEEEISSKMSDLSVKGKKGSSKSKNKGKHQEEEEEEEEVEEEQQEEEEEQPKQMTLAEAKAAKLAKKQAKLEAKKEKAKKKREADEGDAFEEMKKNKVVEIDYDNVDIDDVPGRDPPAYVHLKSGASARSKVGNDIKFDNLTLSVPGKILLQNASLTLAYGHKYGFVGRNGIGKSALVKKIAARDEINIAPHLRVLYVEQEVTGDDNTPLVCVMKADTERDWLLQEEKVLQKLDLEQPDWPYNPREKRNYTLRDIYDRLKEIDADKAITRASAILVGLGFTMEEISTKPSKDYSGGWRMRIALARALFCKPEVLLLDEPSNHLDLHACVWLEKYLYAWDKTLLVVSHEATFLNEVVNNIIHIHDQRLDQYRGNYDDFVKQRDMSLRAIDKQIDKQQRNLKKQKEFISKNKNNTNAKQASQRQKKIDKVEIIQAEKEDKSLVVSFPEPEHLTPPLLRFHNVSFGYPGRPTMFKELDIGIDMDRKIALVGMNGVGKSTLIKLLAGELEASEGYVERSRKCRVARFSQHFVDQLNTDQTPIEYFQEKFNNPPIQEIRNHLGRFGITSNLPLHKITTLSGGQKSRVILAEIAWSHPHILLLDEPTNHLDIDAIEALAEGINEFEGGVVLISHNQHLITLVANEIWVVKKDGTVNLYDGDFLQYKEEISRELDAMVIRS
ncbi:putative non-transporter ABC protein [Heterostelium album PN500]|uniref:Putative non-transporter ABC protein n=1 Tax=Heterostelium pallidum (strain ATCC 26659 / Pp 5 / PN500) TaxID=670386 RepID=D3AVH5_HETP5|nr:putative non-transporter ABC protein [Heterostelium album PN500]EFA86298.1 putative non-transporter ABC protein [Heterostelium album PN500]|eukprot:XP_020438403.1 putative non-transporter ABC protein [Heterostelium album PN500]